MVYVHVPKTGGTSIRFVLNRHQPPLAEGPLAPHARARDYVAALGRERWREVFSFATVRDPYARLVSCWAFAFETGPLGVDRFRDWVRGGCALAPRFHENVGLGRRVWIQEPQVEWLEDEDGELLVERLVRLEDLELAWPELAELLGVSSSLPRRNASSHDAVAAHYDAWTRDYVRDRYRRDFERLGYAP